MPHRHISLKSTAHENAMSQVSPLFTSADVQSYHRDGFYLARGMFHPQELSALKSHIVKLVAAEDPQRTAKGIRVWFADELDSSLRNWVVDQRMITGLQSLVGPNVEFLSAKTIFKNSRVSFASPWHQDWFYWKGSHKITAWIALDQANKANGCLKVIPASHHSIAQMVDVNDKKTFKKQMKSEEVEGRPILCLELEPGDVLFFHDLLAHSSYPNTNGQDRWSFAPTYRNAAIPDDSTTWKHSMLLCGSSINPTMQT